MYQVNSSQSMVGKNVHLKLDGSQYFDTLHLYDGSLITQLKQTKQPAPLEHHTQLDQDLTLTPTTLTPALMKAHLAVQELQYQLHQQPCLALDFSAIAPMQDVGNPLVAEAMTAATPPSTHLTAIIEPLSEWMQAPVEPSQGFASRSRPFAKLWATTRVVGIVALSLPLVYGSYQFCQARSGCAIASWLPSFPQLSRIEPLPQANPVPQLAKSQPGTPSTADVADAVDGVPPTPSTQNPPSRPNAATTSSATAATELSPVTTNNRLEADAKPDYAIDSEPINAQSANFNQLEAINEDSNEDPAADHLPVKTKPRLSDQPAARAEHPNASTAPVESDGIAAIAPSPDAAATVATSLPHAAFYRAVTQATQAATQVQVATTVADWQAVASLWFKALGSMQAVPPGHVNYAVAQQKIYEYSGYLTYAQHNALNQNHHLEFRRAVQAATAAATLTQTAQTPSEWQQVAAMWQRAIAELNAIPASSTYFELTRQKVHEYSNKLRYAEQNS